MLYPISCFIGPAPDSCWLHITSVRPCSANALEILHWPLLCVTVYKFIIDSGKNAWVIHFCCMLEFLQYHSILGWATTEYQQISFARWKNLQYVSVCHRCPNPPAPLQELRQLQEKLKAMKGMTPEPPKPEPCRPKARQTRRQGKRKGKRQICMKGGPDGWSYGMRVAWTKCCDHQNPCIFLHDCKGSLSCLLTHTWLDVSKFVLIVQLSQFCIFPILI